VVGTTAKRTGNGESGSKYRKQIPSLRYGMANKRTGNDKNKSYKGKNKYKSKSKYKYGDPSAARFTMRL